MLLRHKPVSNKELTLKLAKNMRGKFFIPVHVPSFALKLAWRNER